MSIEVGKYVRECYNHGTIGFGRHGTDKDGIQVVDVCHKHILHVAEDCTGKALEQLLYIIPVCKSGNVMKQNMLWVEHTSLVGWR